MSDVMDRNTKCEMLTDRLSHYIPLKDVCNYIGIQTIDLAQIPKVEASDEFKPETQRTRKYHLSKIKHYIEKGVDSPIDIDCFCKDGDVHPHPIIIDGRHRYIAAVLRRDEKIKATFSGHRGLHDYLTGKTKEKP